MGIVAVTGIFFVTFGSAEIQPWNFSSDEEYQKYKKNSNEVDAKKTLKIKDHTDVVTHV